MTQFAKIFEFKKDHKYKEDYQVLVFHTTNRQTNGFELVEMTMIDEVQATLQNEFDNYDKCMSAFENYSREQAEDFLYKMKISIDDATGKSRIDGTNFTKN